MLPKPERPKLTFPDDIDEASRANILAHHKLLLEIYRIEYADWHEQRDEITNIFDHIFDTLSFNNLLYITTIEVHPWNILRALQQKLGPLDYARALELERELENFQISRKCNEAALVPTVLSKGAGGRT